jgi:hypothetical protein
MGIEKNVEDCLVLRINQFVPKRVVFGTSGFIYKRKIKPQVVTLTASFLHLIVVGVQMSKRHFYD